MERECKNLETAPFGVGILACGLATGAIAGLAA